MPTCREHLGPDGWCPKPPVSGRDYCAHHALDRKNYDIETRRRTGAL